MSILATLGLLSIGVVALLTVLAYRGNTAADGKQTRREAIIEVWVGILIGLALNYPLNYLLLPLVGAKFTGLENFFLGCCYTGFSVVRSYVVRRWAEHHIRSFCAWLARRLA